MDNSGHSFSPLQIVASLIGIVVGAPLILFVLLLVAITVLSSACIALGIISAGPSTFTTTPRPTRASAAPAVAPLPSSVNLVADITPYDDFTLSPTYQYLVAWDDSQTETGLLWYSIDEDEQAYYLVDEPIGKLVWLSKDTLLVERVDLTAYWLITPTGSSSLNIDDVDGVNSEGLLASQPVVLWGQNKEQPNPAGTYTATQYNRETLFIRNLKSDRLQTLKHDSFERLERTNCSLYPFLWHDDVTVWLKLTCQVNGELRQQIFAWQVD